MEVTEEQFDRLAQLDTDMYNTDRIEKPHRGELHVSVEKILSKNMFRYILDVDEQAEIASWFYSYKEFYKFGLMYLIRRPFDGLTDFEFGNRMNELPYHNREIYYDVFEEQIDELRWLYLALCEEVEHRKKTMKEKPKPIGYEKIIEEADRIGKRLGMTGEEFYEKRVMPEYADRLSTLCGLSEEVFQHLCIR